MLQNPDLAMKILARDDIASFPGFQRLQEQFGGRVETVQVSEVKETARDMFSDVVKEN